MILNLTFLSLWQAPTILFNEQRREAVTSDATGRLHIQSHHKALKAGKKILLLLFPGHLFEIQPTSVQYPWDSSGGSGGS